MNVCVLCCYHECMCTVLLPCCRCCCSFMYYHAWHDHFSRRYVHPEPDDTTSYTGITELHADTTVPTNTSANACHGGGGAAPGQQAVVLLLAYDMHTYDLAAGLTTQRHTARVFHTHCCAPSSSVTCLRTRPTELNFLGCWLFVPVEVGETCVSRSLRCSTNGMVWFSRVID